MVNSIMQVLAFKNDGDMSRRQNQVLSEDQGHLATHYLVDYHVRTLIGPGQYSEKTTIKFDLQANGNYPFTVPGVFVLENETPIPWTPHFKSRTPICIDHDVWDEGQGTVLLGQLMVHVAKLLNFDEIPRSENYGGYTPAAAAYWRSELGRRPITENLQYPVLPAEIINGIAAIPRGAFQPRLVQPPSPDIFSKSSRNASRGDRRIESENQTLNDRPAAIAPVSTSREPVPMFAPKAPKSNLQTSITQSSPQENVANDFFKPKRQS